MSRAPRPLSEVIVRVAGSSGIGKALAAAPVFTNWENLVGHRVAASTRPVQMSGTTLIVETSTSAWAQQLTLLKPQILRRIAEVAPDAAVTDLRFSVTGTRRVHEVSRRAPSSSARDPEIGPILNQGSWIDRLKAAHDAYTQERAGRCKCGALIPKGSHQCPPCRFIARTQEVAEAENYVCGCLSSGSPVHPNDQFPPDVLREARANVEISLLSVIRSAKTNIRRGQEIPPSVRETIESLVLLRMGRGTGACSGEELASLLGVTLTGQIVRPER